MRPAQIELAAAIELSAPAQAHTTSRTTLAHREADQSAGSSNRPDLSPASGSHSAPQTPHSELDDPHASVQRPSPPLHDQSDAALLAVDEGEGQGSTAAEPSLRLTSRKGMTIMFVTGFAQLIDNLLLTAVNISLPSMARDLKIQPGNTSWLMSGYSLAFGGFLLLAGVMADRYGRKLVFLVGCAILMAFSLAVSLAQTEAVAIVFRAMQGLGAAATVPAAVGTLSTVFQGADRNAALSLFGAAGAIGFTSGLILGGLLDPLGWRWTFRLILVMTSVVAGLGLWYLPRDKAAEGPKPTLDIMGAILGTSGLVLLVFCLTSGEIYGWGKGFIIALMITSVALLFAFALAERRARNPIMPLMLWRAPNFAASWICALLLYCWWQSVVYYIVLFAQNVHHFSALGTALRLLPLGFLAFPVSACGFLYINRFRLKHLVLFGMLGATLVTIPAATTAPGSSFFGHSFLTGCLGGMFISLAYTCINIFLIASVPPSAKGLAGGLANTAYQLGSGVGLAVTALVQQAVEKKHAHDLDPVAALTREYTACMWTCTGMAGTGLLVVLVFLRDIKSIDGVAVAAH